MTDASAERLANAAAQLRALGVSRIESYAWRDLDDPEAGGSEIHADEILGRWAAAGIDVVHRTSTFDEPRSFGRHGCRVVQRGGRYDVFARVIARQLVRRRPADTATIEIWNGVPWFSPLWAPTRRVVWMHHVHREMWDAVLPKPLNHAGRFVETRLAPFFYRRSVITAPSASAAEEIVGLGIDPSRVVAIPNGVDERFTPDESQRSRDPRVVIVGRLAPVKRQRAALNALQGARERVPGLIVDVVGDGPDRAAVEQWVDDHQAADWVTLSGRVSADGLVEAYRRAWLVVSASHAEGWGMALTEGGGCGTPCVVTDISGHRSSVVDGVTGRLVELEAMGTAVADLLLDDERRHRYGRAAIERAAELSWTSVAARYLEVLCAWIESER